MKTNRLHTIFLLIIITTFPGFKAHSQAGSPKVWFSPNTGSVDMLELFTKPTQWEFVRNKVDVFYFNASHVNSWPCYWCEKNTLANLINVQAFSKLNQWNKDIAIAIAPPLPQGVYPTQCNLEYQLALQYAFNWTVDAITNVQTNGGIVDYLIIDEPIRRWYSKFFPTGGPACQIDSIRDIAAFVSVYVNNLQTAYPDMKIGQIILYPEVDVEEIKTYVTAMEKLGSSLSFIHLDVHGARIIEYGTPGGIVSLSQVRADLQDLESFFDTFNIAFGPILTDLGWNCQYWLFGQYNNQTYYDGAIFWINQVKQAIGKPDNSIFQSWVSPHYSDTNILRQLFPVNLPEKDTAIYSHTRLILDVYNIFNPPFVEQYKKQQSRLLEGFTLHQNFPNPFNYETTIHFSVKNPTDVQINIYNIFGRHIITLINEYKSAGEYQVSWNGRNTQGQTVQGGVYIYSMNVAGQVLRKHLVFLQ